MDVWYFISSHPHPMRLIEEVNNDEFICEICNSDPIIVDANFYGCDLCRFYLHTSCSGLPYQIQHPFHPHISQTLRPKWSDQCSSCLQHFTDSPFYWCRLCSFSMDAKCALMSLVPNGAQGRDWIRHFTHPHALSLVSQSDSSKCTALCDIDQIPLFGCHNCGYNLDKPCANLLPRQIHHPLHPHHREALVLLAVASFTCSACGTSKEERYNLGFSCNQCSFWLCLKCAKPMMMVMNSGNIKYEDHQHLLYLVENVEMGTGDSEFTSRCDGHDSYCTQPVVSDSDEFQRTDSTMLWCFHCDFKVHLLCGPLPSLVKHEFHIHPLALVDSLAEDDYGKYYCDVCEAQRDPRIRLYCCHECKYFAHVHCVYPEIVKILRGELKDVELKTVGQALWTVPGHKLIIDNTEQALTLIDVINNLSAEEKECLRVYYKWAKTASPEDKRKQEGSSSVEGASSLKQSDEEEIIEILQLTRFTDESFESLKSNLQDQFRKNKPWLKPSDLESKIVKVQGYMIPHSLAAVLNTLLDEFGDIGIGSSQTLEMKSLVLFIVCQVVKKMHSTLAKCINKNLIQEWYYHIRFAKEQAFMVDFACVQLELLVHAFLGFQAKRLEHEIPTNLTKKIVDLQRKLDKCNEYRGPSLKSEYMKYCLSKASEFEWKDAFGDSLTKKDQNRPSFQLF